MSGRDRLAEIPAGTELLRGVRHLHPEDVADCTDEELNNATRWLRAAGYSCTEGARRLESIIQQRGKP